MAGRPSGTVPPWAGPPERWPRIPALPRAALASLRLLADALDGDEPPCAADPDAWASRLSPEEAASAVAACRGCPARRPCRAYGQALRAAFPRSTVGVFGGRYFGRYAHGEPSEPGERAS